MRAMPTREHLPWKTALAAGVESAALAPSIVEWLEARGAVDQLQMATVEAEGMLSTLVSMPEFKLDGGPIGEVDGRVMTARIMQLFCSTFSHSGLRMCSHVKNDSDRGAFLHPALAIVDKGVVACQECLQNGRIQIGTEADFAGCDVCGEVQPNNWLGPDSPAGDVSRLHLLPVSSLPGRSGAAAETGQPLREVQVADHS